MKNKFNTVASKTFNAATSQTALGLYLVAAAAAVAFLPPLAVLPVVGEALLGVGVLFGVRAAVDYKKNKAAEKNAPSA